MNMNCRGITATFAILIGSINIALAAPIDGYRYRACLNGEWEIAFSSRAKGRGLSKWTPMRVPSLWKGINKEAWVLPDEAKDADTGVYRLKFALPEELKGKRIKLYFELIDASHSVSMNGKKIREREYLAVCESIDVTGCVKWRAENELTVETRLMSGRGKGNYSGIGGDVFIEAVPEDHIGHVLIDTSVERKELVVRTRVSAGEKERKGLFLKGTVLDGGRPVLELPSHSPGKSGDCSIKATWQNPKLWGYGEYGSAHLYWLRMELWRGMELVDVKHERFGFREFGTKDDRFMLNGKPIFIKGDLYHKTRLHTEHPAAITAFLQRMRDSGMNFLRGHSKRLDNSIWAEVADELGFMFQPEMVHPFKKNGKVMPVDGPEIRRIWRNYVIANYNHPSIVSWCVNNEAFSVGHATERSLAKIKVDLAKAYDTLISDIYDIDGGRIVEINHNYCLWPFVKNGVISRDNFRVFNIHPYGNLKKVIDGEVEATGFNGEVPILVGEIYCHDKKLDFVQLPKEAYAEQMRVGASYARQISEAAAAKHVSGIVLCAESGNGYIGYSCRDKLQFGPWDEYARIMDGLLLKGVRQFNISPRWPSLSGVGMKVDRYPGWKSGGGNFGLCINWSDPTVPMYRASLIDNRIKKAFASVGGTVSALPKTRIPEAVVVAAENGAPLSGRFVWLEDNVRKGEPQGTLSDSAGTAWFRLPDTGSYSVSCGALRREFEVSRRPILDDAAGYGYLTWVELGDGESRPLIEALAQPVEKQPTDVLVKGEMLENGSFDFLDGHGRPFGWNVPCPECTVPAADGGRAIRLTGGSSATQMVRLKRGKKYRISGTIMKTKGSGKGNVRFKSMKYREIFSVSGGAVVGKAESFDCVHLATGEEQYFYVDCSSAKPETEVVFDGISVRLLDDHEPQGRPPEGWNTSGTICEVDGVGALMLKGKLASATRTVSLTPGHKYRVEAMVRSPSAGRCGVVGIRSRDYKWVLKLESSGRINHWEYMSDVFTVPIGMKSAYFYCMNWYQRPDDVIYYTDVKISDLGSDESPVVVSREAGNSPEFTDDGRAVVYQLKEDGRVVYRKVDLSTGERTELQKTSDPISAKSGKGNGQVATGGRFSIEQVRTGGTLNLRFMDRRSGKVVFETQAKNLSMQIGGCHSPVFMPDGRRVVYVSEGIQPVADIIMVDLTNGSTMKLTSDGADNQSPAVSPDGRNIVFSSLVSGNRCIRMLCVP